MNYTKLKLENQEIGLKFGMPAARFYNEKVNEGKPMSDSDGILTEVGMAYVLLAGYKNNCISKEVAEELTFEVFLDHVEQAVKDEDKKNNLVECIKVFFNSLGLGTSTDTETDTKKKKIGTKSKS